MNKKKLELINEIKFCINNIENLLDILENNNNYNNIIKKHILILLKVNFIKIQNNLYVLFTKK
jgi:hypothetical protein